MSDPPNFSIVFGPRSGRAITALASKRPQRLPVLRTLDEVRRLIEAVKEPSQLIVKLLYGSGLRFMEALTLRVKDIDFAHGQVTVRDPKWKHDRVTMPPCPRQRADRWKSDTTRVAITTTRPTSSAP